MKNTAGQPVKDAVVTFTPAAGAPHGPIKLDGPMTMAQHNTKFEPFVLIAPVGADVAFPNKDKFRHHVYSFSAAKRFELKLYGHDETRSVHFDKPGIVALGCNIHDSMSGFIDVVETPYAAKTGADGRAELRDAPAGRGTMRVWQPYLRGPGNEMVRTVTVAADGKGLEVVTADVRPPPPMVMSSMTGH